MKKGLIVSASMPRSASAFYVKLKQDLFKKVGGDTTGLIALSAELGKDVFVSGRLESRCLTNLVSNIPSNKCCFIKVHVAPTRRLRMFLMSWDMNILNHVVNFRFVNGSTSSFYNYLRANSL